MLLDLEVIVLVRLTRTARATLLLPVLLPLLLAACTSPATPHHAAPSAAIADCGGGLHARPSLVQVMCASDAITARNLAWSAWGKPIATALGIAVVDTCAYEDCHTGAFKAVPIVLIASKIVNCPKRAHAYSRLQYVFVGTSPFNGMPAHPNFSNYISAPDRAGPARNQTVTLGC